MYIEREFAALVVALDFDGVRTTRSERPKLPYRPQKADPIISIDREYPIPWLQLAFGRTI
jgi:hypothetical protein